MQYQAASFKSMNKEIDTEEKAIDLVWRWKLVEGKFECKCGHKHFYQLRSRPEVRECKNCGRQHRVRAGTIFQSSKIPLKKWLYGLFLMMSGKRGISALELQRHLNLHSYQTAWNMLQKIRLALMDRDAIYKLAGTMEVDATQFGSQVSGTAREVLIGVETKEWVDGEGKRKKKAGFAQVMQGAETKNNAEKFIAKKISPGSTLHVDGAKCYELDNKTVSIEAQLTLGNKDVLSKWHPWMHRFVSNAKIWILGTHHGINPKYLMNYLAEYTYRFNRRHDTKKMFSRALAACLRAKPRTMLQITAALPALYG